MIRFLAALVEERRLAFWVAGSMAIVAGSVLPWVHVASPLAPLTEIGLEADGKITVLCGLAALGLAAAYARLGAKDLAVGALALAVVTAALSIVYVVRVNDASSRVLARLLEIESGAVRSEFAARPGLGVWVVAAGAVVTGLSALALLSRKAHMAEHPAAET